MTDKRKKVAMAVRAYGMGLAGPKANLYASEVEIAVDKIMAVFAPCSECNDTRLICDKGGHTVDCPECVK